MKKKTLFLIIIVLVILAVTLFVLLNIKNKNNSNKLNVEKLYEYGEYVESLDIPPNTIVARINGEEILFHEIESYRYSINYSIENGSEESIGKNAFYEVLTNKLAAYMAKEYPDASNYNLNIDNNLEKTKNEWLYGYGEYTVEEARERWLKVLYVEKDEIWLDEDDWITYLQNRSVEMMLTSKGNSIIFDFIFEKPELANDKLLEKKLKEYNDIKEQQKKYMDEGKQEEALELYSQTGELLTELREIYEKDLILNSNIELCVDKNELSYTVPVIYGKKEETNKYYWENTSTEGFKKITEEQAIETAKRYAKDLGNSDSLVGKYLKDYNKVFSVNEKRCKPNNYWYITEGILERQLETADFERDVYEIILVSEHDEMEIERAYFYVDVYTNCVIAGHYTSD